MTYRYLPHTADIKVAIQGPTLETLFHDGVTISRHLFVGQSPVESREERPIGLDAADPEELFLRFLKELLYLYETSGFVPSGLVVESLDRRSLVSTLTGEQFDDARHQPEPEVKAVTRHGLTVVQAEDGWYAEVVFDV
jgi:SHS2 domain-containing protein